MRLKRDIPYKIVAPQARVAVREVTDELPEYDSYFTLHLMDSNRRPMTNCEIEVTFAAGEPITETRIAWQTPNRDGHVRIPLPNDVPSQAAWVRQVVFRSPMADGTVLVHREDLRSQNIRQMNGDTVTLTLSWEIN